MSSTPISNRPMPPVPPPMYPAPRSRMNPWWVRLPILAVSGSFLLVMVLLLFLLAFQMRYQTLIFPGVTVYGEDLGGLTTDEARLRLAGRFTYPSEAVFTFRDGGKVWQMTAADLGVEFDLEGTIQQVYAVGHGTDVFVNMLEQANAWFVGYSIAPVMTYNEQAAADKLHEIATTINRPALNAALTLNSGTIQLVAGQTGRTLDVNATLARLREMILRMERGIEIPLVINETPPLVWNVDEAADKIRTALSAPITLTATDANSQPLGPWVADVPQLAQLLKVERISNGDGTESYNVSLDTQAFTAYLETLAPGLIVPTRDGRFHFNEATGQLEMIQSATSGRQLNVPLTLAAMEQAVFSTDQRTVPMVFDYTLPRFHNQVTATELGIREIVAESTTYFVGSGPNRRANIALAASKFDGLIIGPGEEFSFNYWLGEIGPETGFLEDKVIFGGETTLGYGGGACQVSTTLFRAAYAGGFAITERNSHGYRVGYYEQKGFPPGLDAAIWQPERDFRFQNNTPYHLLIEVSVLPTDSSLQFRFYSTKHWNATIEKATIRNIEAARPTTYEVNTNLKLGEILQVDYAAEGADVTVNRIVYDLQGNEVTKDYIFSHYLAWGARYEVAPGDPRLNNQGS